ncbi:MAG: hypothetical protein IJF00_08465 [Bacteroidaceae bacterium]|nr:hypothetical protein [Bacteroidaceae bacterium]MBQ3538784.1 hypothetical protein [Bacteroidaceae bacterium]MBQ6693930.1 hypothetical protein [Bacteroidaceae bacterium]
MKAINKYLCMMFMAMSMMFAFSACSSDDDDNPLDNPGSETIQEGKWSVNGNTYTYTIKQDYGYISWTMKWELTFGSDDKCSSSKCVISFPDKTMAQEAYNEYKADGEKVTISGKNVTIDYTDTHKGLLKSELLAIIEAMDGAMNGTF